MQQKLSALMLMSWRIQRKKKTNRSKSLTLAWALFANEDIFIHYLHARHSPRNSPAKRVNASLTFF
jgi:hypothetical protein